MFKRIVRWAAIVIAVLLVAAQLVPYGRASHSNPPVRKEPAWDSPRTRDLVVRACFDCHSNETKWPWYSHVAPVSWLVQRDVDGGRKKLNFSEFDRRQSRATDAWQQVDSGDMPLWYYLPLHSNARLSVAEKEELVSGLQQTFDSE